MHTEVGIQFCAQPREMQPDRSRVGRRSCHGHGILSSRRSALSCISSALAHGHIRPILTPSQP